VKKVWKENSLSITLFTLFLICLGLHAVSGHKVHNEELVSHGDKAVSLGQYLSTGDFVESVAENFESEFLQMGAFVVLTIFLRQKGSPESKMLDEEEPEDADPKSSKRKDSPSPIRAGGLRLKLYENSLSLALFALFFVSFFLHAWGGASAYNSEQSAHGGDTVSVFQYFSTSRFWFESTQNWQSEFMAVGALVGLSVFLRQKGSPESKPVAAPHSETGS